MNIGKMKRFLVFFLSIAMVFTMMPTAVFADGGGAAGGSNGTGTGGKWSKTGCGHVYVWFDEGGWTDSTSPGSGTAPHQGSYNKNTDKWIKAGAGPYQGLSTYEIYTDKLLTPLVRAQRAKKGDHTAYKYSYIKRSWLAGKNDTTLKNSMELACKRAVNRSHSSDVYTARVVGVATTYRYGTFTVKGKKWSNIWCIMAWPGDKTFTNMFGNKGLSTTEIDKKLSKSLKDKYGWGTMVDPNEKNDVKTNSKGESIENWRKYVWRISKEDNKQWKARTGKRVSQIYVVAVADNEPQDTPPEFDTKIKDFQKGSSGVKIDATEPGNVKVQDEILYKNVDKDGYQVGAELIMSDKVSLTPAPEIPDDDGGDSNEEGDDVDGDEGGVLESEDGVVVIDGKTVTIDDTEEAYANYTGGKWWAVCLGKNDQGTFDNNNVILTQELTDASTELDVPSETLIAVYYMAEQPNAATDSPLVTAQYVAGESGGDDDSDPDVDDTDDNEVDGQTIAKTDGKVTPSPNFVVATSDQEKWQTGSFITLNKGEDKNGNTINAVDLYKAGLFTGVDDFNKVYTAGIRARVYDGSKVMVKLNYDMKNANEATKIECTFGTLTFDKQALYNHKNASVVETGSKFEVYSKEFASYDAAVADAQAKGYETYKYEKIVIDNKSHNHGNGLVDYIDWQLHNGMLAPGTYVIKQTSAGDFSQSTQLVDPFEIEVPLRGIGSPGKKIENPPYLYELTVEKRSTNFWRPGWEPQTEDPLFSTQTQFKLESLDDEKNVMGNGDGELPTAINADGSLVSSTGYMTIKNTDPWTIVIDNLPSGRYRITEDAPIGYWLPADKASVEFKVYRDMNGQVAIDDLKAHDAAFTKIDTRKDETADRTSYKVTFTRSNVHQKTWLKLHKDRDAENILGNTETEGFPYVEFNLYSVGDIRSYDGHKDHVYYTDGQLIRGITIDEETGQRHYYNDGKEVSEETFRIMTNLDGDWDSGKVWNAADASLKNEGLVEGGDRAWKWFPLTNNNLIDTYDASGNATGEKDGVSKYKFQEMYIWEFGDHISFSDSEKSRLAAQWTENYTKEGTVYGSMDEKIPDIGLSMNQILNHGIDITENDSQDSAMTGDKTYTYSSFGIQLDNDDVVMAFLRDKVLQYVDPANGVDDTTEVIKNNREKEVGTIEYNLLVLWPDQKTQFPKIDETNSEFQVLPDNIDTTEVIESVLQMFTNEDIPQLKTVAEVNEPGNHIYNNDAEKVTIHDTVSYYNLKQGREYEMSGTLYNIEETGEVDENGNSIWSLGEPILGDDGTPLTVTEKFIPKNKKGKVEMIFNVTPKQLNYDNVVVYERCKLADDLIVEEADPSIASQQVYPIGDQPVLETVATYADKHIMPNDSDVTFIDTVEYWLLTPGTTYTLRGTLMDKETGEPVQIDGKDVTVDHKFTASAKHSFEAVPFEINTSDLDGKSVVVFEELLDENGAKLKDKKTGDDITVEHKDINDENQTIGIPSVSTTASDEATEEHVAELNKKEVVIDVVNYTGLIPGEKYTVKGKLMKKPDGSVEQVVEATDETPAPEGEQPAENAEQTQVEQPQPLEVRAVGDDANAEATNDEAAAPDASANEPYEVLAEAEKSFTADAADGSIELKFTVDATKLHGHSAVAFETIYDDETGLEIAIHRDINDRDQTIDYPEIETTALDGNIKLHVGEFGTTVTIIDTVNYKNVTPGLEYELTGTLMDKATGDPLKIDGKVVKASKKFTPEAADGAEDLTFELDSTKLGGTSAVAFEELTYNDVLVAEHKDIEDEEQTVDYPEIKTIAVDAKTRTHEGLASDDVNIIDTVQYKNLTPGVEYIVRGVLMDKETGDVYISGKGDAAGIANAVADAASDATGNSKDAANKDTKVEEKADTPQAQAGASEEGATNVETPKDGEQQVDGETPAATTGEEATKPEGENADGEQAEPAKEEAKEDGAISGDPKAGAVVGEVKFIPTEKDGEVEITFNIKNGDVAGKRLVAFESIYVLNEEGKEVEVGRHEDITDPDQTVGYPEIRTNAVDAESGEHVGLVRDSITVKDKVTYKGLTPGQTYTVVGTLMDKETGKPIVAGSDANKKKDSEASGSNGSSTTSTVAADAAKNLKPVGTAEALGKTTNVYNWGALANYLKATGYATYDLFVADADKVTSEAVGKTFMNSGLAGIFLGANESLKIQMSTGEQLPIFTDYIEPGQEGSFYGIQFVPGIDGANENAYGLATIHVKNNGSEKAQMGECEITSIDRHLEATEKTTEEKASETKDKTEAEKAAEGAQTSGAVTAQKTFTPDSAEGSVEIEFTFTGVDMSNRAAVAFEKLYAGAEINDYMIVATHEDLNDADQTVFYPTIDTKASYKDGVITDTVTYTNLIPGLEYELTGTLMDKSSGNSMEISAMTKFTPKEANGTVEMKFEVDKDKVAGKSIVVFETLKLNGKVVAEHHDINDKDQTVTIDKKNPSKETKESKDSKKDDSTDRASYKTGDFLPYILMAVLAMILASIYVVQRRRRREEE